MPIGTQYRPMQIQPGAVHFHGQVIFDAGPAIDAALTVTPGVTWVRTGVGVFTCTFNDGVTVGVSAISFTSIVNSTGKDPILFTVVGTGLAAGQSVINVETSTIAGTLGDPLAAEGWCYDLVRLNTSVVLT